jgi:putative oxidoreductase
MSFIEKFGPLIGRVLIALLFVPEGFSKVTDFSGSVGYITANGLPMPQVLAAIAIVIEIGAGLALLIGLATRWAAALLFIFCLLTAFLFHNFWAMPAGEQMMQSINFHKNLAIAGGLLFVMAFGAGPVSADARNE